MAINSWPYTLGLSKSCSWLKLFIIS